MNAIVFKNIYKARFNSIKPGHISVSFSWILHCSSP